jgi:hypothetical protein
MTTDADVKAAHKRFLVELLLEQAAPPVRSHQGGVLGSSAYGRPVSGAQADRNFAVLEAAISRPRRRELDGLT